MAKWLRIGYAQILSRIAPQGNIVLHRQPQRHVMQICITIGIAEEAAMTTLTVTARGQVTFRKEVLQHLGIKPGEKIELELLPEGRGVIQASRPSGTIDSFVGLLAGRTRKIATLEEINEAAAQGWAGKR
jgi:bifunctional DNA-binding transcriptional regulator/antitoxin component of YhaV-PrlF toxin-antitoxin module